jgi:uncharacterized protein (TIGR04255 family)
MSNLLRNEYTKPNILICAAQIMTGWSVDELTEVSRISQPALEAVFGLGLQRTRYDLSLQASPGQPAVQNLNQMFGGLEFKLDDRGSLLWLDVEGVIVSLVGPYPGRDSLFSAMTRPIEILKQSGASVAPGRISVVVKANIPVPEGINYKIDDYILPRFEFQDSHLNTLLDYRHEIAIDLSAISHEGVVAKVTVESGREGRLGIDVTVDVLDYQASDTDDISSRLRLVKDLESHVFESLITDKTRELYGIVRS